MPFFGHIRSFLRTPGIYIVMVRYFFFIFSLFKHAVIRRYGAGNEENMVLHKKMLVLKQITPGYSLSARPVSGIVRAECENGVTELTLSFLNFRPCGDEKGRYRFFLTDGKNRMFTVTLPSRPDRLSVIPEIAPDLASGIAAGVCFVADDIPAVVAFSRSEGCLTDLAAFKRAVAERLLSERKNRPKEPLPQKEQSARILPAPAAERCAAEEMPRLRNNAQDLDFSAQNNDPNFTADFTRGLNSGFSAAGNTELQIPPAKENAPAAEEYGGTPQNDGGAASAAATAYDDEAVATENYYALDREIYDKTEQLRNFENEYVRFEDGLSHYGSGQKAHKSQGDDNGAQDEGNKCCGEKYSEQNPYYLSVRKELDDMFGKFPEESCLQKLFPGSRWAHINYSAEKYYVVGLVKEEGKEKYICYGIPAPYSETAPAELAPYCSFVPVSLFDMKGDGFWMMFQSAQTGECILLSEKRKGN